ncbi:unnamed protein product [Mytilus edulis]|uniref:Uncharacterized protein n=1 Tax=Mytilus edulis TaxID=6550 RepID=A0A8S3PTG6_MYTED|nr:unnamed protein product [Mytilus edulis]
MEDLDQVNNDDPPENFDIDDILSEISENSDPLQIVDINNNSSTVETDEPVNDIKDQEILSDILISDSIAYQRTPVSQAAIMRLFSIADKMLRPENCALSAKRLVNNFKCLKSSDKWTTCLERELMKLDSLDIQYSNKRLFKQKENYQKFKFKLKNIIVSASVCRAEKRNSESYDSQQQSRSVNYGNRRNVKKTIEEAYKTDSNTDTSDYEEDEDYFEQTIKHLKKIRRVKTIQGTRDIEKNSDSKD